MSKNIRKVIVPSAATSILMLIGLILAVCAGLYWDFLTGKKVLIFFDAGADTFQYSWPLLTLVQNTFKHLDKFQPWFFQVGLGMDIFSFNRFFDWFNWLLIAGTSTQLAYGLIYLLVFKIVLAGLFFYAWVRMFDVSRETAIVGSLLYAFNSYMMLWGQFVNFATMLVYAPLLLFAVERALRQSKWLLFAFFIGISALPAFQFFYVISIALFFYIIVRVWQESQGDWKKAMVQYLKFGGATAMGIGLVSFVVLPCLDNILSSPRVVTQLTGVMPWQLNNPETWITVLTRLFSDTGIFQSGNVLDGTLNWDGSLYESPHIYTGLVTWLIVPQLFLMEKSRLKQLLIIVLVGIALALSFPYIALMFEGFNRIAYRWSFLFDLFLLLITTCTLNEMAAGRLHFNASLWFHTALVGLVVYGVGIYGGGDFWKLSEPKLAALTADIPRVAWFLVLYSLWGWAWRMVHWRPRLLLLLMLLVASEMVISHYAVINQRYTLAADSGYLEAREQYIGNMETIIADINAADPEFYRIGKNFAFTWGPNDPMMIQGFKGTSCYTSFQQPSYVQLLEGFNANTEKTHLSIDGIPHNRPWLKSLLNVRYFFSTQPEKVPIEFALYRIFAENKIPLLSTDDIAKGDFKKSKKEYSVYVYKNPAALPLGFVHATYLNEAEFKRLSPELKDRAALQTAILHGPVPVAWGLRKTTLEELKIERATNQALATHLQTTAIKITSIVNNVFQAASQLQQPGIACFAIPYDDGWKCWLDGKRQPTVKMDCGLIGIPLPAGSHQLTLRYTATGFQAGGVIAFISAIAFFWVWRKTARVKKPCTSVEGE